MTSSLRMAVHFTAGDVVGDSFRLIAPIGEGGMGAVWIAEQLSTGKERALKVMHPQMVADPRLRERFAQEARIGARVESDHIVEVAKGGQATVDGIRLRCRAHNQYTAEVTFGVEFMRHKRDDARRADAGRVTRRSGGGTDADTPSTAVVGKATMAVTPSTSLAVSTVATRDEDVLSVLRRLGFRVDESRDAALRALGTPDVSLEKRVAVALSFLGTRVACRVEKPLGLPS